MYNTAIQNNQFWSNINKVTHLLRTEFQGHNWGGTVHCSVNTTKMWVFYSKQMCTFNWLSEEDVSAFSGLTFPYIASFTKQCWCRWFEHVELWEEFNLVLLFSIGTLLGCAFIWSKSLKKNKPRIWLWESGNIYIDVLISGAVKTCWL